MFDSNDQLAVNTIRTLCIDAIQKANSGHPGLTMGAAPMAYSLWSQHLNVNPKNSKWINRDRFVLSAGHGSMLLYSLLHLSGFDVSMEDIKSFRQWNSKTPGHPEVHYTDGVEATTGPLGQGFANCVGMAMAEAHLAATYNKENYELFNHHTYALVGDGCLMEGVSAEAASLAGHLKLGKLIVLYDSNDISLDGPTSKAFTENVGKRFEAYGWQHIFVKDGNDLEEINAAILAAKLDTERPTLIEIKTTIGYGAPNAGSHTLHGAPLGADAIAATKENYNWSGEPFYVPEEVKVKFNETIQARGEKSEEEWNKLFEAYASQYSELASQLQEAFADKLPEGWESCLPTYDVDNGKIATRKVSHAVINSVGEKIPALWGGSADLSSSNNTLMQAESDFSADNYLGRNIWYGVREFAMACIANGIMLHGGSKTYVSTFFAFVDYLRGATRVAAISHLPVIYVFTHDSIAVGEDGPTHEPIEHLESLRCMPNLSVIRPADANETVAAWEIALNSVSIPTMLILTRQDVPVLPRTKELAREVVKKGAYVLSPQKGLKPEGILMATGSEVQLALKAQEELYKEGLDVSVVSMPSIDLFEKQDEAYKESVLPNDVRKRVSIEMASTSGWGRYVGLDGISIGIDKYGASAPGGKVIEEYGFTVDEVVKTYKKLGTSVPV